jgi:hypothetical protein
MAENERKTISLEVKLLTGKSITLELEPGSTILELKKQIEDKEGFPPGQYRLICMGKRLSEDEKTLEEANIGEGATIHVTLLHWRG